MFVVVLRFSEHRIEASRWMAGHKAWLQQGFEDGVFLLAGSLQPQQGGIVLAHQISAADLHQRVDADPFVSQGVVNVDILEIAVARADERLRFLLG